jgi:hypothetical protein
MVNGRQRSEDPVDQPAAAIVSEMMVEGRDILTTAR